MTLTLQQVGVSYGRAEILKDISTTVTEGCTTALMGANGCGKTTLLRCIAGLLRPTSGEVLVDGRPVEQYNARDMARRVAIVRQHQWVDFDFTAEEIVMMGRNPYLRRMQGEGAVDYAIVERCMRQMGVWQLRRSHPSALSGGELQRVMIARALAQQTPLLLLDEPLNNLDVAHQIEVMRTLGEAEGRTVVIVIHDLNLALRFCDRLLLLHEGRLIYAGATADGLTPENIRRVYGVESHVADGRIVFDY